MHAFSCSTIVTTLSEVFTDVQFASELLPDGAWRSKSIDGPSQPFNFLIYYPEIKTMELSSDCTKAKCDLQVWQRLICPSFKFFTSDILSGYHAGSHPIRWGSKFGVCLQTNLKDEFQTTCKTAWSSSALMLNRINQPFLLAYWWSFGLPYLKFIKVCSVYAKDLSKYGNNALNVG